MQLNHLVKSILIQLKKQNYVLVKVSERMGCATGITTGVIVQIDKDYLYIKGDQISPFAIYGDSGSLIIDTSTKFVLGVVSEIKFEKNLDSIITRIVPIWKFYDWLVSTIRSI